MSSMLTVERYTETDWCNYTHAATAAAQAKSHNGKPMGTWISVPGEDDWPAWCRSEGFALAKLGYRHTLQLDMRRVLLIDTLDKLDAFNDSLEPRPDLPSLPARFGYRERPVILFPWWAPMVERYAGIVIAPYQWERRYDYHWYYGWDCASGCIWDPSVLLRVKTERVGATV